MSLINLLAVNSVCFDISQTDVADFKTKANQERYFDSKIIYQFEGNLIVQPSRFSITIKKPYAWVVSSHVNYVYMSEYDRRYYYFVTDVIYKGKEVTQLVLELDVWQTYLFDFEIMDSFITRCHVNRWNGDKPAPYCELDEGLPYGELMLGSKEDVYQLTKSCVITSTVPLGKVQQGSGGGGGSGSVIDGIISANGLYFVKQEEGYASYGAYFNGESFKTGGYGVTENYQTKYYRQLEPFPVSEEKASKVTYDLLNKEFGEPVRNVMKARGLNLSSIPQHQFDVWISLAFNYGMGGLSKLNAWQTFLKDPTQVDLISEQIRNLKANPNRRKREAEIFKTGKYPTNQILKYGVNGKIIGYVTENNGRGWLPSDLSPSGKYVDNKAGKHWLIPTTGVITGGYPAYPSGKPHNGIDIGTPVGTPVYASKDGIVRVRKELTTSYGKFLIIAHGESDVVYGHCSELLVSEGQNVKQGQMIARSGNTGNSTGPHLHFEIRNPNGEIIEHNVKTVNPMPNYKVGDKV